MSDTKKSLLPLNATNSERQIESVILRSADLPLAIASVWNPEICPVELLPWLAWALSVDIWDSQWPENTKRLVIAESIKIHRTKGTVSAIKGVLKALGITAELQEWFEVAGPPHTFILTAWVNENRGSDAEAILGPALYQTLQGSVGKVKPVRSHYDFRVGARFSGELGLATIASTTSVIQVGMEPEPSVGFFPTPMLFASHMTSVSYLSITMVAL